MPQVLSNKTEMSLIYNAHYNVIPFLMIELTRLKHGGKEYIEYTGLSVRKCTEPVRSET